MEDSSFVLRLYHSCWKIYPFFYEMVFTLESCNCDHCCCYCNLYQSVPKIVLDIPLLCETQRSKNHWRHERLVEWIGSIYSQEGKLEEKRTYKERWKHLTLNVHRYLSDLSPAVRLPAPSTCQGHLGNSKPESYVQTKAAWTSFPTLLQDSKKKKKKQKLNVVVFQTVERISTPEAMGDAQSGRPPSVLCLLQCCSNAFIPRGSSLLALRGSCCSIFCNIGPCFLLSTPALLLTSCPAAPPLTSIFFSVVTSLVLRAEITCFSALRAYTFSCWHMSPHPLSRGWRRGFQSIVPGLKPAVEFFRDLEFRLHWLCPWRFKWRV